MFVFFFPLLIQFSFTFTLPHGLYDKQQVFDCISITSFHAWQPDKNDHYEPRIISVNVLLVLFQTVSSGMVTHTRAVHNRSSRLSPL